MKKIIVANWKMNPQSLNEAKKIFNGIKKAIGKTSKVETVVCPPFVYLSSLHIAGYGLRFGAQDVFYGKENERTGEISVEMLKNLDVKYIITGHSERRAMGETDEIINQKNKIILESGLKAVFCLGEKERDLEGNYLRLIKAQIEGGLKGIPKKFFKNLFFAYEPVWAIGKRAKGIDTSGSVFQTSIYIRKIFLSLVDRKTAENIPILYGGSINEKNAPDFLKNGGVQGLLIGRASLDPQKFRKIFLAANSSR